MDNQIEPYWFFMDCSVKPNDDEKRWVIGKTNHVFLSEISFAYYDCKNETKTIFIFFIVSEYYIREAQREIVEETKAEYNPAAYGMNRAEEMTYSAERYPDRSR